MLNEQKRKFKVKIKKNPGGQKGALFKSKFETKVPAATPKLQMKSVFDKQVNVEKFSTNILNEQIDFFAFDAPKITVREESNRQIDTERDLLSALDDVKKD